MSKKLHALLTGAGALVASGGAAIAATVSGNAQLAGQTDHSSITVALDDAVTVPTVGFWGGVLLATALGVALLRSEKRGLRVAGGGLAALCIAGLAYAAVISTNPDTNGDWELTNVTDGSYRLIYSAPGYETQTIEFFPVNGDTVADPVVLDPSSVTGIEAIVINEILGDADSDWNGDSTFDSNDDEWVELFNPTSSPVDLNGCYLSESGESVANGYQFPAGSIIPAGGFVVIYGGDDGKNGNSLGALSNSGDTVTFSAPDQSVIDSVTYGDEDAENDITYRRYPDGAATFDRSISCAPGDTTTGCPSPGSSNGLAPSPTPTNTATPSPTATETNTPSPTPTNTATGAPTFTPSPTPTNTATATPFPAGLDDLVINEVLADPASSSDWNGDTVTSATDSGNDEWIEIYNSGSSSVSLLDCYVADDDKTTYDEGYRFGNVTIPAGGYVVVFGADLGTNNEDFGGLNNGGDTVLLYKPDGTVIDTITFDTDDADDDITWRRVPDGGSYDRSFACDPSTTDPGCPSLGSANQAKPSPTPTITPTPTVTPGGPTPTPTSTPSGSGSVTDLVINEVLADPASGSDWSGGGAGSTSDEEWIEIYNTSPLPVDITGCFLGDDDLSVFSDGYEFGSLTIPGNGFVVVFGEDTGINGNDIGGGLSNGGDTVILWDPSGTIIDQISYNTSDADDDKVWRLYPDGGTYERVGPCGPAQAGTADCPSPGTSNTK